MQGIELKEARELAGLTQIQLSNRSGVSRMKLSLADCEQVNLTSEESTPVRRVLEASIRERSARMQQIITGTINQRDPVLMGGG